uniref:(northern house mosquito) hypothetical protein n=1 Tax=Culex pipiens TaxID=7175 RepID=A0A8D8F9P6_CULPI
MAPLALPFWQPGHCCKPVSTKEHFPLAAVFGAEIVEEALEMQRQLAGIIGKAGFELHKWCSNRSELLAGIPEDKLEQKVLFTEEGKTKTLGITWQPDLDVFCFDIHSIAFSEGPPTKRKVLSDISKFFEPCGLAAPVVMTGKIYMQDMW